jgi:hypothetical protein
MIDENLDLAPATARRLDEILKDPKALEPPEALIPRLVYRGRITMLAGREKDGKSTLASAAVAKASQGAHFLGERTKSATTLWLGLEENIADVARRFMGFGADPSRIHIAEALPAGVANLAKLVEQTEADIVVADTLAALAEGHIEDASSSSQWTPIMTALRLVAREYDAGLLLDHHARKSDGRYRDSSAIGAGVDLILEMGPSLDDPTVRKIQARGRWHVGDFAVRFDGQEYNLLTGELTTDAKVLVWVQGNPGCGLKHIRDGIGGRGSVVDAAVARLVDQRVIEDRGNGRKHSYFALQDSLSQTLSQPCPPYRDLRWDNQPLEATSENERDKQRDNHACPDENPTGQSTDKHGTSTLSRNDTPIGEQGTTPLSVPCPEDEYERLEREAIQTEGAA